MRDRVREACRTVTIFFLILALLIGKLEEVYGNPYEITAPRNTAALSGTKATLECSIVGYEGVVTWRDYLGTTDGDILSNNDVKNGNHRFAGSYDIEGRYNLNLETNLDRSGMYGCGTIDRVISKYSYLIVLETPVCTFPQEVEEGETVNLDCRVTFSGSFKPEATWYKDNSNDSIQDATRFDGPPTTLLLASYQAKASDDGVEFSCGVSFATPPSDVMPNDGDHDQRIPIFKTSCSQRLSVKYSVRNPVITGVGDSTEVLPGEKMRCSAEGNPVPIISWYKLEGNGSFVNMTGEEELIIESDMIGFNRYMCVGTNNISGIIHSTSTQIVFYVKVNDGGNNQTPSGGANGGAIAGGIIGALIAIGLIGGVAFIVITRRRNLKAEDKEPAPNLDSFKSSGSVNNYIWRPIHLFNKHVLKRPESTSSTANIEIGVVSQWEIPRQNLMLKKKLGEGSFGQVMKAEAWKLPQITGSAEVAVKMLKENASDKDKQDLLNELDVMKSLPHHVNVVSLLGCCTEKDPIMVVVEFVAHGNLKDYLTAHRATNRAEEEYNNVGDDDIGPRDLLSFGFQTAKGMEHIAKHNLLHRDLAARNILVGECGTCKVSDFGFARDVIDRNIYHRESQGPLPIRWMSPESIFDNVYTSKSDVWSYGILLWEIVTMGANPYPGMTGREVMATIKKGIRMEKPDHCTEEIYDIMKVCWAEEPDDRPSFTEVTAMVEALLQDESDYLCLDDIQEDLYMNVDTIKGTDEKI